MRGQRIVDLILGLAIGSVATALFCTYLYFDHLIKLYHKYGEIPPYSSYFDMGGGEGIALVVFLLVLVIYEVWSIASSR